MGHGTYYVVPVRRFAEMYVSLHLKQQCTTTLHDYLHKCTIAFLKVVAYDDNDSPRVAAARYYGRILFW